MQWMKMLTLVAMSMALAVPAFAGHAEARYSTYPYSMNKAAYQAYHKVSEYRGSIGLLNRKMRHVGGSESQKYKETLQGYNKVEQEVLALVRKAQGDLSSSERSALERELEKATDRLGEAYSTVLEAVK